MIYGYVRVLLYSIHEKTHKFVTKFVTYKKRHGS